MADARRTSGRLRTSTDRERDNNLTEHYGGRNMGATSTVAGQVSTGDGLARFLDQIRADSSSPSLPEVIDVDAIPDDVAVRSIAQRNDRDGPRELERVKTNGKVCIAELEAQIRIALMSLGISGEEIARSNTLEINETPQAPSSHDSTTSELHPWPVPAITVTSPSSGLESVPQSSGIGLPRPLAGNVNAPEAVLPTSHSNNLSHSAEMVGPSISEDHTAHHSNEPTPDDFLASLFNSNPQQALVLVGVKDGAIVHQPFVRLYLPPSFSLYTLLETLLNEGGETASMLRRLKATEARVSTSLTLLSISDARHSDWELGYSERGLLCDACNLYSPVGAGLVAAVTDSFERASIVERQSLPQSTPCYVVYVYGDIPYGQAEVEQSGHTQTQTSRVRSPSVAVTATSPEATTNVISSTNSTLAIDERNRSPLLKPISPAIKTYLDRYHGLMGQRILNIKQGRYGTAYTHMMVVQSALNVWDGVGISLRTAPKSVTKSLGGGDVVVISPDDISSWVGCVHGTFRQHKAMYDQANRLWQRLVGSRGQNSPAPNVTVERTFQILNLIFSSPNSSLIVSNVAGPSAAYDLINMTWEKFKKTIRNVGKDA
ncbi:uncharacterized protein STEHIDRAFT_159518 [Stereum hirsutum FP-91666 SS1]|uniref:uncharacterized protein n=1 Tax=Stereum hirsutum (strain FP-91666) TaxID=721885 RepID=UPI000444A29E|nr:uncharacterized protein STEHIDRAFT_159518 [Stereum hirsutum FP-91666 SS1]EIM83908.1 hypothetical protein STEHIDRAFT_159518 [Stereum hirsutum FP-91666 SS1]